MTEHPSKKVFIFLNTDKHASPFDILKLIDIFPEAQILKYENITVEDAEKIIYDSMFPRGPKGAKHTKIFIGGSNFETINKILEKAKKCMFPPFELAVIVDPNGAYTTASAAVAKTLELSLKKKLGNLEGKNVTILAGTGPVGKTAATLYAMEKAKVTLTSRNSERAAAVAAAVNKKFKTEIVKGLKAETHEEIGNAIKNAEIILSTGAAGVQLLPLKILEEYGERCRIVADVNAIPPLGVEGLDVNADGSELLPNIFGIGALTIGTLKNKVEEELFRKAAKASKGIFDYKIAYKIAKSLVKPETEWWTPTIPNP